MSATNDGVPFKLSVDESFINNLRILGLLFHDPNVVLTKMLTNTQKQNLILQIENLKTSVYGNLMDERIARMLNSEDEDDDNDDDVYEH